MGWPDAYGEVSYSQLYEAVLALADGADSCPACGTELAHVHQNPFERARAGLLELEELSALQLQESKDCEALNESTRALWAEMVGVVAALQVDFQVEFDAAQLPTLPDAHVGEWLTRWTEGAQPAWGKLLGLVGMIEQQDAAARRMLEHREQLVAERKQLDEHRLSVERLRTAAATLPEYFSPSWTAFQSDRGRRFSGIVDDRGCAQVIY